MKFYSQLSHYSVQSYIRQIKHRLVSKLRLILVRGSIFAQEAGEYSPTAKRVRAKPIWVCQSKGRMMYYDGDNWTITLTSDLQKCSSWCFLFRMISSISDADVSYEADWSPYLEVSEVYLSSEHRWVPAFKARYTTIWRSSPANPQPDVRSDRVTWFDNEETVKQSAYRSYFLYR